MSCAVASSPTNASNFLLSLLHEQQDLSAVDTFARQHEEHAPAFPAGFYRDLIPLSTPKPGEQYAFDVNLDACSGCKSCVAACHNLNGLDDDEAWREVGMLTGGSTRAPVLQHITTACHHCIEPACLDGCPVIAYEKDPVTGIVRHLDDQCIGCQYCVLKCPYDVPKYNAKRGIVRKCDMCHQRLAVGEAPACVQACPNQAIRVTIVNQQAIIDESEADVFLPGAPAPGYTLPTTLYRTKKSLPRNLLPADYYAAAPQHAHWPLVWMLVLTQMSVGAFTIEYLLNRTVLQSASADARTVHLVVALALGALGLFGSLFHLGRPWLAYRAIIGLRTSWLSREILCFSAFAGCAVLYAVSSYASNLTSAFTRDALGAAVVFWGGAGVWSSVMVYHTTQRPYWHWLRSGVRFGLTAIVLGLPVAILVAMPPLTRGGGSAFIANHGDTLFLAWAAATSAKLIFELSIFVHSLSRRLTPLKRTASLLRGDLARATFARFFCGVLGGVAIPLVLSANMPATGAAVALAALAASCLCFAGELLERYLYFTAVIAPKMPGAPAA